MPKEETELVILVKIHYTTTRRSDGKTTTSLSLEGLKHGKNTVENRFLITDGFIGKAGDAVKKEVGEIIIGKARDMIKDHRDVCRSKPSIEELFENVDL